MQENDWFCTFDVFIKGFFNRLENVKVQHTQNKSKLKEKNCIYNKQNKHTDT